MTNDEREHLQFVMAIAENPRDYILRKVFSDWLRERGRDTEADIQFEWDDAKQDATERMHALASHLEVSWERLFEECKNREIDWTSYGYFDTHSDALNQMWEDYSLLTGDSVDPDTGARPDSDDWDYHCCNFDDGPDVSEGWGCAC